MKWRVLKRSFTSVEGVRVLINNFRIYDLMNTGKVNKDDWVSTLYDSGLTIGISRDELSKLFDKYKEENSDMCDYKKFAFDIFFKHQNKMNVNNTNINNNYSLSNSYNPTEVMNNQRIYNNNRGLNLNINNSLSNSQSQKYMNTNDYNLNSSMPLINTNINNNYNLNYSRSPINTNDNYRRIRLNSRYNDPLNNMIGEISYNGTHINMLNSAINYFRNKIHVNNGLTYYRFVSELKAKCNNDNNILKSNLPLALQSVGVFYTQNELQNLFDALGCAEITVNYFSFSKIIEIIKGEMNDSRKNLVKSTFNNISNNNDSIPINSLKEKFYSDMHPDVLNNRRSAKDVYNQFCESLDIYTKLNNLSTNINLEQFVDFYSGISPSIFDDRYFSKILNNVWSNDENTTTNTNNNINNNNITNNSTSNIRNQNAPSSTKINYDNLDYNNLKNNYNKNERSITENNYSNYNNNSSIKERINNNTVKVNLPLFYYNKSNIKGNITYVRKPV